MKNWKEALLTILFVLFIITPAVVMVVSDKENVSKQEKRRLAELGKLKLTFASMKIFPAKFEAYFNDHFGLRTTFVKMYSKIIVNVFRTSPQKLVTVGKKNWLFYADDDEIVKFTGYHHSSDATIDAWKQILADRQTMLAAQGIHYLFMVGPNKSTVYPEFLPERIRAKRVTSALEKLNQKLASPPQFTGFIDLQDVLLSAKNNDLLFYESDTHWNHSGAYAAYTAITTHLSKKFDGFQPIPREQLTQEVEILPGGDMAAMINLREQYTAPNLAIGIPPALAISEWKPWLEIGTIKGANRKLRHASLWFSGSENKTLTAVFVSDSFGYILCDYLALHFKKIILVISTNARFEDAMPVIQKEHPDVVLDLIVERRMPMGLKTKSEGK